jgi:hypothetical protein
MPSELDSNEHYEADKVIGDCRTNTKVYQTKHKLDKQMYAVKEIRLLEKLRDEELREIEAMSSFSHPNKVRYNNCWISKQGLKLSKAEVGFGIPMDTTETSSSKLDSGSSQEISEVWEASNNSGSSSSSNTSSDGPFLCIAMELCEINLKQKLNSLNNTFTVEHFLWTSNALRDIANVVDLLHQKSKNLYLLMWMDGRPKGISGYFYI